VTVEQEGALQQPIPANQPPPDAGLEFSQALERQISQAIQPALEDFRRQMAQTLEREVEREVERMPGVTPNAPGDMPGVMATEPVTAPAEPIAEPTAAATQSGTGLLGQVAQQAQTTLAETANQLTETASQSVGKAQHQLIDTVQPVVTNTIRPALERVERQGEEWATSLLVAALTTLLTDSSRRFVEQRVESGLRALTQKLFEAAPEGVATPEMPAKVEAALMAIVHDTLDALFSEGMRASVQQGGQAVIQQSFHGDFGAAVNGVEEIARRMSEALLTALRQQWSTVLRLVLALALLAVESSLAQSGAHKVKDVASAGNPSKIAEKATNSSTEKATDKPAENATNKPADKPASKDTSKDTSKSASGARSATKNGSHAGSGASSTSKSSASRARSASHTSHAKDAKDAKS
jgi:hypothetical protein